MAQNKGCRHLVTRLFMTHFFWPEWPHFFWPDFERSSQPCIFVLVMGSNIFYTTEASACFIQLLFIASFFLWSIPDHTQKYKRNQFSCYRPFSHCIDQAGLGAFTAKSGRKHYNPPPLTVMWMNFDSPNFPTFCSLSVIISFQTCSNKCILYVLSFHKCIKIKYKMVNMYRVFRD